MLWEIQDSLLVPKIQASDSITSDFYATEAEHLEAEVELHNTVDALNGSNSVSQRFKLPQFHPDVTSLTVFPSSTLRYIHSLSQLLRDWKTEKRALRAFV